jgi:hypothetical protein
MGGRTQAPRWVHDTTFRPPRGSRAELAKRIAELHAKTAPKKEDEKKS